LKIILAKPGYEELLSRYYLENHKHFEKWNPITPLQHHSVESWKIRLKNRQEEFDKGQSAHFIGLDNKWQYVIGGCSLTNIIRGVFQACHMGYSIDYRYEGQGKMKRIVEHAIDYAFNELELNRIMANHMPANYRSAGLLKRLGFEKEGYARRYLHINGQWEDHVLTALINPANRK